jgi:hypothetical protein
VALSHAALTVGTAEKVNAIVDNRIMVMIAVLLFPLIFILLSPFFFNLSRDWLDAHI